MGMGEESVVTFMYIFFISATMMCNLLRLLIDWLDFIYQSY